MKKHLIKFLEIALGYNEEESLISKEGYEILADPIKRADKDGKEYSIVGRIKRLEERYLKQMSELETMYLSGNCT